MTAERRRLHLALILLLLQRVRTENAEATAQAATEDMGFDDCPICLVNRRREAWQR